MTVLWNATLDNTYDCYVERISESSGILTIYEGDQTIFTTQVRLSFGAIFGPDILDIRNWENIVINYIDSR